MLLPSIRNSLKNRYMHKLLGSNWKTSLIGLLGSIALLAVEYINPGDMQLKTFVEAAVLFLGGRMASDSKAQ
jgi:hypothetical protein